MGFSKGASIPFGQGRGKYPGREVASFIQPVGEGVSEMRIDYGPGYRVYFKRVGREIVILLAGGDKRTQSADIKTALRLARGL
jgi:putative addiction module killer protein